MKTWLDVTDFLAWEGNFTGLQRIQYNLAKQYLNNNIDIGFFVYDSHTGQFKETEFNPELVAKNGIISGSSRESSKTITKAVNVARRHTPTRLKQYFPQRQKPAKSAPFKAGDTVLVLGGIWFGDFIYDLTRQKEAIGFKFVHFIHDMIPVLMPGHVVPSLPESFSSYKRAVFSVADGIIANSQSTANDALDFMKKYSIPPPLTKVVRIGEDQTKILADGTDLINKTGHDFILCVGTVEGRKNHAALFYAVKEAKRRGLVLPKIVIAGRNGWLTDDIRYTITHDLDAKEAIVLLGPVNEAELCWLYKHCKFTVYPSFYEGWGMPIAESLAHGKVCVASSVSSMTEIADNLVDHVSPYDTGAFLDALMANLDKKTLRTKEAKIRQNYKPTTWEDMFTSVSQFISKLDV